ncbi:MAG: DUF1570 domain-containing protein [Planctomycetes bacterium]|nr:DUF1570 domain-containing protein [Planctomycetota bacterium]
MTRHHVKCCAWILVITLATLAACAQSAPAADAPKTDVRWTDTRQVGPFIFHATFSLEAYKRLFAELPELQHELTRTLGVPPAKDPIYVYLFSDEDEYRVYKDRHFPRVPFRPALYILDGGSPGVYTYRKPDLEIDVRHECTHALLHAALPVVPLWLDEGLAKYFEVPASQRAFDHPYFDDLKWTWSLRLGMVRTMESLEECEDLTEMDAADYRFAWAWVHFMLHGPEAAHRALVGYLACNQKYAPAGKLSARVAEALPNPTEQMIQHFQHWHE